jgi:hypothetical protein
LALGAALALAVLNPLAAAEAAAAPEGVAAAPTEGAAEAIAAGEKLKAPAIKVQPVGFSLKDQMDNDLRALGVTADGWSEKKERYVAITEAEIAIQESRATVENVVPLLFQANLIVCLRAMQEFSQWLGAQGGLEVNLSTGASPVGALFEEHQARFRREMSAIQDELKGAVGELVQHRAAIANSAAADQAAKKEVDDKIAALSQSIDLLNKEASGSPAPLTRMNRALDAVMKKLDPNYDPASAAANAQAKAAEMQVKFDALKSERADAVSAAGRLAREKILETEKKVAALAAQVAEKKSEAEGYFKEYTQDRTSSKFNWSAEYSIVGLIPIKYYYGIVPGERGALLVRVAAAYAWSPATEREVRGLLVEDGLGKPAAAAKSGFASYDRVLKKGELSVADWVRTQDPLTFGPARWYVDNEGEFHVLGSAIVVKGQGARASKSQTEVLARANMALRMSLDIQFKDQGTLEDEFVQDENDSRLSTKVAGMMEAKSKSKLSTSQAWSGDNVSLKLQDGGESKELRFRIIKLSAKSVRDAYQAVLQQADTAAQAKVASARREGSRQAARDHVKAADAKLPAARAEGYGKAASDLAPKPLPAAAQNTVARPAGPASVEVPVGPGKAQSKAPVKTGVKKDNTPVPDF